MAERRIIGIDENGLGPRMGPLVVTGVRLRAWGAMPTVARLRAATGLDDSKLVFSRARRGRGEALALGVLAAAAGGATSGFRERFAVPAPWSPPPACPSGETARRGRCGPLANHRPVPRWAAEPAALDEKLADLGLAVDGITFAVLCPGLLNLALAAGASKLAVDLALFEVVATELARDAGGTNEVLCGKVGGTDRYAERFALWRGRVRETVVESRARSTYEIDGVGRVSFVRDADATEPATAIASVVGKYVRELWMDDVAAAAGWDGPAPSGYHDAATTRLASRLRREIDAGTCRLPAGCVLRAK